VPATNRRGPRIHSLRRIRRPNAKQYGGHAIGSETPKPENGTACNPRFIVLSRLKNGDPRMTRFTVSFFEKPGRWTDSDSLNS